MPTCTPPHLPATALPPVPLVQVDTLHSIAAKLQTRREATEMRANVRASTSSISGACGGAGSGAGPPPLLQVLTGDDSDVVKALEEAKQQLLESVLHCADIGAPALPFEEARTWAIRVVDEFKQQTETELRTVRHGLTSSPQRACSRQRRASMAFAPFPLPRHRNRHTISSRDRKEQKVDALVTRAILPFENALQPSVQGLPTPPAMLQTLEADTECTAIGMQVRAPQPQAVWRCSLSLPAFPSTHTNDGPDFSNACAAPCAALVPPVQVQFISYFVQPIWGALEKVLPEIHGYNATIAANLAQFKELHAQLLKRKAAASAPAVAAEREVVSSSSVAATSTSDGPPASSGS